MTFRIRVLVLGMFSLTALANQTSHELEIRQGLAGALNHGTQGEFGQAKTALETTLGLNERHPTVDYGNNVLCIQNCLAVIDDLNNGIIEEETAVHVFATAVGWTSGLGREAVANGEKAVSSDPDYAKSYLFLAFANLQQGRQDEAVSAFTKTIDLDNQCATAFALRGMTLSGKGQYGRALGDLDKAVSMEPGNAIWHDSRARILYAMKDYDGAVATFTQALACHRQYYTALVARGRAHLNSKQHDQARRDFDEAVSLAPDLSNAHFELGLLNWIQKDYETSLLRLNRAIEIDPRSAGAFEIRARVYFAKDEIWRGLREFIRALWLNPRFEREADFQKFVVSRRADKVHVSLGQIPATWNDRANMMPSAQDHLGINQLRYFSANVTYTGPALYLYPRLATSYPEHLQGVKTTPLNLLAGAVGIRFRDEVNRAEAFFPLAIELPDGYWKECDRWVDISSVNGVTQVWDRLRTVRIDFAQARRRGQKILLFDSLRPVKSDVVAWPENLPLATKGVVVILPMPMPCTSSMDLTPLR